MAARFSSVEGIVRVALGCVALTSSAYYLSPPGGPDYEGIFNTGIGLAAIGLTTLFAVQQRTAEASLRRQSSEIGKLNEELSKRARELEASNGELESFAYSVSHDLRAPLRHVDAFSELLQKQAYSSLDEKGRRYIKTILEVVKENGQLDRRSAGVFQDRPSGGQKTLGSLDQLVKTPWPRSSRTRESGRLHGRSSASCLLRRPFDAKAGHRQLFLQCGEIHARARLGRWSRLVDAGNE